VLHELAHTITVREYGVYVAGHGWQFCAVYLGLVLCILGREKHDVLKAAFKAHRIRFTPPRPKRQLMSEQRTQLTERLAAAREAKTAKTEPRP
jgi:hypothetical protein